MGRLGWLHQQQELNLKVMIVLLKDVFKYYQDVVHASLLYFWVNVQLIETRSFSLKRYMDSR